MARINANIIEQRILDKISALNQPALEGVTRKALSKMDQIKNKETRSGRSPAVMGEWNNRYNAEYAKRQKGGSTSPVTLRNKKSSIERTHIITGGSGGSLNFTDSRKAKIFKFHQDGTAKGGKIRQIYPETIAELPKEVTDTIINGVRKILEDG